MSVSNTAVFTLRRNLWVLSERYLNKPSYIFGAKSTPWPNDNEPPMVDNSVNEFDYKINNEMLFGKYISMGFSRLMIPRYDWQYAEIYDRYDHEDPDLFNKRFYVMTPEAGVYNVFKCLNNNNGALSTQQPLLAETAPDDVYYSTSDGYQWKYMYTIDSVSFNRFSTADYIPVIPNSAVTSNAINGAIETYVIDSGGANYNSYTNGYFTEIAVGGNNQFFGIQGPDTTVLTVSSNTYQIGEVVTQIYGGVTANGIVVSQTTANATAIFLNLRSVNNIFNPGANVVVGANTANQSVVYDSTSPDVSSNNNFYNGCSIYIASGTGAGQIGKISQYLVIGNARRILLANAFVNNPDLTSKYIISPRVQITGDGTGATALSSVDPNTKQIKTIEVINRGQNYTYANVTIFGNTGSAFITANNATVRAVLSPRGGHGYDPASELNAQQICFSATFTGTEGGKLSGTGSEYRRVGIIVSPQYANVLVSFSNTGASQALFAAGTYVYGSNSGAVGTVTNFYSSNSTIKMSNVTGVFVSGDLLTSKYSNGVSIVNASSNSVALTVTGAPTVFDNRKLLVCPTSTLTGGTFNVGDKIVQIDGTIDVGYAYIHDLQTSGSNTHIYLTEVKGYFQSSDIPTSTYKYIYDDPTRQVRIQVNDIIDPDMVPYTGDILYVKNIEPVTRDASQSETIKLIYGFS
jgi:hypothetical protein